LIGPNKYITQQLDAIQFIRAQKALNIVGIAKIKRLNAMTAQRQREAQDCYAALGTKALWFTEIHYAAGSWDRKRRIIANINNDLTSGKSPIADIESLNSYFLNVL